MSGSGTFSVVTKGALTGGATSSQANGFFGAYLRFSGFDGILLKGAAPRWIYLYIHDGGVEFRDADHLIGKDTYETEDSIKQELGYREKGMSVFCIGPAGENLVRFAMICGDKGHVAAHNGVGAVLGSKKVKAIAVAKGGNSFPIKDKEGFARISRELEERNKTIGFYQDTSKWGTLSGFLELRKIGVLPVKNYTTSIYEIDEDKVNRYSGPYIREHFEPKRHPCWACRLHHSDMMTIPEGPYAGRPVEEPEYEGLAAWGPLIGVTDVVNTIVLANEVDRLGMDTNETGWLIAWLMECYEKGMVSKDETEGLEMVWGNWEAVMAMLQRIARREGFGNVLAEGVMRAARQKGTEAQKLAIHSQKGTTVRGHDHRALWFELFDTCVSNSGTIETHSSVPREVVGLPPKFDPFNYEEISTSVARTKGGMQFDDSLGTCRFNTMMQIPFTCRLVNAATGWDLDVEECLLAGRRAVNLFALFNLRHGVSPELNRPSFRYGSTPVNGPAQGKNIMLHWGDMLRNYYSIMGWDEEGRPLPETVKSLGIDWY
jgi:aldehyde:ferredoxin oxidoreductase